MARRRPVANPPRVVRATARQESPFMRLLVSAVGALLFGAFGFAGSFFAMKGDLSSLSSRASAQDVRIATLELKAEKLIEVVAKLDNLTGQFGDMRRAIDTLAANSYPGGQAASDRSALSSRLDRAEAKIGEHESFRAQISEALAARRSDPDRISRLERSVGDIEAWKAQVDQRSFQFGGKP